MTAAFHEVVGLGCLIEWESAVDVRSDCLIFEHWPDDAFDVTGDLRLFIQALGPQS